MCVCVCVWWLLVVMWCVRILSVILFLPVVLCVGLVVRNRNSYMLYGLNPKHGGSDPLNFLYRKTVFCVLQKVLLTVLLCNAETSLDYYSIGNTCLL